MGILDRISLGGNATESGVVAVDVGTEPLGEEVRSFVRSWGVEGRVAATCSSLMNTLLVGGTVVVPVALAVLGSKQTLFFGTDRLRQGLQVGSHCAVEADVVKRGEDQHDDHQNERAECTTRVHVHIRTALTVGGRLRRTAGCQCEKADEADLSNVEANKDMLQCARVDSSLGVDVCVIHVEHVVAEGEVEEVEADGSEQKDQRSNNGVADCDDLGSELARDFVMGFLAC